MIRTPFDQFGKEMVSTALQGHGLVLTEQEVAANPRTIDVWFSPRSRQAALPNHLGLLGWILCRPCTVEFQHKTPNGKKLAGYVIKHGDFRHLLSLDKKRTPHLVVVSELPVRRDTLLLRLLGADGVLRRAPGRARGIAGGCVGAPPGASHPAKITVGDPHEPRGADERRPGVPHADPRQLIVESWRREAVQEGLERGVARSLINFYEARFGAMPDDVRAIIEDTHEEATLSGWVKLAGTRSADEVAAAIRASRPA